MSDRRISVVTRQIRLLLSTDEELSGETFLHLHGEHDTGGLQRLDEVLNGRELFLPVRQQQSVALINLQQVVAVTAARHEELDPLLTLGQEHTVRVEPIVGPPLKVSLFANLPDGKTRVKDYLNQDKRFLLFLDDELVIYLARDKILRVEDG